MIEPALHIRKVVFFIGSRKLYDGNFRTEIRASSKISSKVPLSSFIFIISLLFLHRLFTQFHYSMSINGTLVSSQVSKEKGDNKMKRNILLALAAALTLSLVVTGLAFAQGYGPGGNGANTGTGLNLEVTLSDYMPAAMADVLGLNVDDVDEVSARLESGETFYSIALSLGYTSDQLPALITDVREKAIELATAAGAINADQSAFLLGNQYGGNARGNGTGTANMYSTGDGTGICDGTCISQNLSQTTGGSMMRRGGHR
jgi:hypothetical protein